MSRLRILDLFSGIGGISLGLERTGGFETAMFCETEPYCQAVLRKHWPEVYCHDDIRTLTADFVRWRAGHIDIIAGGFPCQDISLAGKGAGITGERSGLWVAMLRLVREVRPAWVLAENVAALRTLGADTVLADLEALDYAVWPLVVGAHQVGAPHIRERVWIVAHADGRGSGGEGRDALHEGRETRKTGTASIPPSAGWPSGPAIGDAQPAGDDEAGGVGLAFPCFTRLEGLRAGTGSAGAQVALPSGLGRTRWPARPGERQHDWEEPRLIDYPAGAAQSPVGAATNGLPVRLPRQHRVQALKAIGNSVVPQVVEAVGRAILALDEKYETHS